ncbi:MAG: PKD domain-containing protein [Halobacteriota archaeon]
MSASEAAHSHTSHSLVDSLCGGLEAELHKEVCAAMQKAISDTVCASLKRGIHEAVHQTAMPGAANDASSTPDRLTVDVCVSVEEIAGSAVCAALKQVAADTVCKALKEAISARLHKAGRWDDDMPFHVTPEALNIPPEELLGNAACAAMKQVFADTVCKALRKAIDEATASVVLADERQGSPSLSEMMRAYVSVADAGQLHLSSEGVWYVPDPNMISELCAALKQRMAKEVCSRLQQLATSVFCARLKKAIRKEIREHPDRCEQCKSAGHAAAAHSVLTLKTGMMVVAVIAVAAVALAAALPGPLNAGSTPATTTLSLYSPITTLAAGGGASLSGALKTSDGSGISGQIVELQRQSNDTWTTLGSASTLSDGSFTFELQKQSSAAATPQPPGNSQATLTRYSSSQASLGNLYQHKTMPSGEDTYPSTYAFATLHFTARSVSLSLVSPLAPVKGDTVTVKAIISPSYAEKPLGSNGYAIKEWTIKDPSGAVQGGGGGYQETFPSSESQYSFKAAQSGNYDVTFTLKHGITDTPTPTVSPPSVSPSVGVKPTPTENVVNSTYSYSASQQTMATAHLTVTVGDPGKLKANIQMSAPPYNVNKGITLDGSQSQTTTVGGPIISYKWTVSSAPQDSTAQIAPQGFSNPTFTPDKSGGYIVHLEVTDRDGAHSSADSSFTVSSIPSDGGGSSQQNDQAPSSPSDQLPSSHPTVIVPSDPTPSPNGHLYRASFQGSAHHAGSTSIAVRIDDNSSTLSATTEVTGAVNASVSTRLRFL